MQIKSQLLLLLLSTFPVLSYGIKPMTDGEVRDDIIRGNISKNTALCPCPYSMDNHDNTCGTNSQYNQAAGSVKCYQSDITDAEVAQYRQRMNIEVPKQPWDMDKKQ